MTCNLTILSTDTTFHATCVVVTTESSRFLFDAPEGTQRLVVEHKIRVGKIQTVFLTSCDPFSVGGLTGNL